MLLIMNSRPDHGVTHCARLSNTCPLLITLLFSLPGFAVASELEQLARFNTSFLKGAQAVDLQLLLSANSVLPGNYRVDLYSNETLVGRRDIEFRRTQASGKVEACLTLDMLQQLGIDMAQLQAAGKLTDDDPQACHDLPAMIEHATVRFDASRLRLMVSVPQQAMQRGMRGYVDPALWDHGVAAAFFNYQLSSSRTGTEHATTHSNNLGLRNGINLGAWRLRNESNLSTATGQPNRFTSNRSYVQHDVTALKGQFSAGDIFSDTDLFDSVRYRGLKLASDEGMRADSERGYAPIIRGVAQTNATVEISQNDYILYTASVPPGPFEISDIYPSGSNGDLQVTVIEADGQRRVTVQAFSSLPIMVREGQLKYSVSAGRYNSNSADQVSPQFVSSTLAYGVSSNLTGIVGMQTAENFQALAIGAGRNTPVGAVSVDLTHSASRTPGQSLRGNSLRALYAKTFSGTDTTFTLAAYRYSTEGYRTLSDHVQALSADGPTLWGNSNTRTDVTINQSIGRNQQYGSIYLNASDQRYWGRGGARSLSTGYSNYWGEVSYNLGASYTRDIGNYGPSNNDTQVNLSASFPLGSQPRAPRAYLSAYSQKSGDSTQVGINGYVSESSDTYYSVQAGNSANSGSSGSFSVNTRTSVMDISGGYSQGRGYNAQNLNLAGSVVAHAGGINLGQSVGETFALAEVPGVAGVKVGSYSGATTGANGFAVVPNAQPYRVNWITLDTRDLGAEIDIDNATQQVVPRRGAVVVARYIGKTGRRVQFELFDAQGSPLPFGAALEDADGKQVAIADPSGKALALTQTDAATLTIKWADQQCQAPYSLPERNKALNYERVRLMCTS